MATRKREERKPTDGVEHENEHADTKRRVAEQVRETRGDDIKGKKRQGHNDI